VVLLRSLCAFGVALTACTSPGPVTIEPDLQSSKADGMASHLELIDDHKMDVDEPSDLALDGNALWTISDRHSKLYQVDDDGDVKGEIDIEGSDFEALAIDEDGHFYVADESAAKIWRLGSDGERKESFEIDTTDGNSGIEGLAFDHDGVMYVAKEKSPATIIMLDDEGRELDRKKLDFADDLSALAYNRDDKHMYALSDEEHKLWRLDSDLDRITSWKLPIDKPEGLAFDGDTLYVVSDSEERIYIFELD
jgi:VCBS repeat-containing protein